MSTLQVASRAILVCLVGMLVFSSGVAHGYTIYLKFDGIDGESQDKGHEKWAKVDDVSWGVRYSPGSIREGAGRAVLLDLTWAQQVDKTVPKLFNAIATGDDIPMATVDFTQDFGNGVAGTYLQMTFTKVLLTELSLSASGQERATIEGAFAYSKITMTYTEFDSKGSKKGIVTASYDLEKAGGSAAALAGVFALGSQGPGTPIPMIPEPSAWPPMLVALGLLGRQLRQSRVREAT